MKRIKTSAWLLIGFLCPVIVFSQNNPIFFGGRADGWHANNYVQQSSGIFRGGNGDGWTNLNYQQAGGNIFRGGSGDGWSFQSYLQTSLNIFKGGNGDGWHYQNYVQASAGIFSGGIGDGWASNYRPQGPLPVSFLSFTAQKYNDTEVVLQWRTASEFNASFYAVERSADAVNFQQVGMVRAAGNSSMPQRYDFIDHHPVMGLNYYRIKQVDLDGKFVYTPVRVVRFGAYTSATAKFFPNPTRGLLFIELSAAMAQEQKIVNICNAGGAVEQQFKLAGNQGTVISLDLGRYPKGTYFIQVITASASSTQRVVLQ